FITDVTTSVTSTLSLHDALPICKVSAEVDLVHQQTQNQRYGSSHIGATAKDISNVVTDAASGVVDIRNILCSSANMRRAIPLILDRKSGSAGMPRPISYAVFCLK